MEQEQTLPTAKSPAFLLDPSKKQAYQKLKIMVSQELPQVDTLDGFYDLISAINSLILTIYNDIQCSKGCSYCCKFYGSPHVYKFEWEKIISYLDANFSEHDKKRVRKKLRENISYYQEALEGKHDETQKSEEAFNLSVFYISECPFLYKNICSIYPVRPTICRIFGLSTAIKTERKQKNYEKILACSQEKQRWKTNEEFGIEGELGLPDRLNIEEKLAAFLSGEELILNSLLYWLSEYFDEF